MRKGKLIIDASCVPADIRYPTDLSLLNEAREKTEKIIDLLHASRKEKKEKPRTYRQRARKDFLAVAKKKRCGRKKIRKAIRKQLGYVNRNLRTIKQLSNETSLGVLKKSLHKELLVISEVYRQQKLMFEQKSHKVEGRIVSITQPHIRPIVRGKARANVEFGAKISVSVVDGYTFLDRLSWESYNEGNDLMGQVEKYKERFGYYPESVHADKIYLNRKNRQFCNNMNIRISGVPLGRPPKDKDQYKDRWEQFRKDEISRIAVEGKFGVAKRRYGLGLIKEKLKRTSEASIALSFLMMNLDHRARSLFDFFILQFVRAKKALVLLPIGV